MHWLTPLVPAAALLWHPALGDPKPKYNPLPPLREQARIQDAWTEERKATIPALLKKHGVDAWIVSQREYGEETVFWSLKPAETFSARRRTTCLFLASPPLDEATTTLPKQPGCIIGWTSDVWDLLKPQLEAANPATIAVDAHPEISFAGGLRAGEYRSMAAGLGGEWASRMVVKPEVAVEYIAAQPASRLPRYREMMETAWAMVSRAFSAEVVTPGNTTTADVEWWLREEVLANNFSTWFQPDVSVVEGSTPWGPSEGVGGDDGNGERVIQYGDMLHVDFGVTAMGLNTDTQHLGYVLRPDEEDVPESMKEGLKKGNQLQDIVRKNIAVGKTGNEMLKASINDMHKAGIQGRVYSHPIGDWGHSAGPVIGMTNMQDYVSATGELAAIRDMWYSVELYVEHWVPEKNQTLWFALEEDVYFDSEEKGWKWVYGRQEKFHLIKTSSKQEATEEL